MSENVGYVFRSSSSLSDEHYAGCDEACREIEAEPLSDEEALRIANLCRSREGLPLISLKELQA